jgi:hypothetical protein
MNDPLRDCAEQHLSPSQAASNNGIDSAIPVIVKPNSARWRIVITRLSYDPATRNYLQRRCTEGKTKTEAIRCLKRYVAREIYNDIRTIILTNQETRIAA